MATKKPRSAASGRFEVATPINDPGVADQAVRWVRAMDELLPMLAELSKPGDDGWLPEFQVASAEAGVLLRSLRQALMQGLKAGDDKEFYREASKKLLTAPRRPVASFQAPDGSRVRIGADGVVQQTAPESFLRAVGLQQGARFVAPKGGEA